MARSHKNGLMVSMTAKRGLHVYFQKRASTRNQCIGSKLRGQHGNKASRIAAFKAAVAACH